MSIQTSEQAELERLRKLSHCACGDQFTEHDLGQCGACVAGGNSSLHVELERLRAEVEALRNPSPAAIERAVDAWFNTWTDTTGLSTKSRENQLRKRMRAAIDAAMREQAMQALVDQAQELGMGYGERK